MSKRDKNESYKKIPQINHKRQKEIFDPRIFQKSVTVAGLGNIGSQTVIALARLGLKDFYLYDPDTVEEHNIASQSYYLDQVDLCKTESLQENIERINRNVSVCVYANKFSGEHCLSDILIIAVDSMKERQRICTRMKKHEIKPKLIIDGRMGGPQLEIYTCQSLEEWEDAFVDNPSKDPCGARSICYISMIIGALIANQVKRFLKGESYKKTILFNIDSLQLI